MKEIIKNYSSSNYIYFLFVANGGRLDIILNDKVNSKKYSINKLSKMREITSDFQNMNNEFHKKGGVYERMNKIKSNLSGSNNTYTNTIEIGIPKSDFISYDTTNVQRFVTFLPAVITDHKYDAQGKNLKNHLTIVMAVIKSNSTLKALKSWKWDQYFYYDNFCLNPPTQNCN